MSHPSSQECLVGGDKLTECGELNHGYGSAVAGRGSKTEEPASVKAAKTPRTVTGALDILRKKVDRVVRAMSLPVRQSVLTRDPFPELSSSPLNPTVAEIILDTSARSTPSSSPPETRVERLLVRSRPVSRSASEYEINSAPRAASSYDLQSQSKTISSGEDADNSSSNKLISGDGLNEDGTSWTPTLYKKQLLFFYTDVENYRALVVDSSMLVCDVCRCLVEKNHAMYEVNWVVVEYNVNQRLERILEDHEKVHSITRYWSDPEDFRLYFRKDFRKFEPFKNPANFLSPDMVDNTQLQDSDVCDLLPSTERYNHILLQHLFVIERLPDIMGHCYYKDSKKSWKKLYCVLKSSGLYYSNKGTNMEPNNLVLVSDLSTVDIHSAIEAKKFHGAPHPHCLCLKHSQSLEYKELIFLCVEDQAALICWHTALRLTKYKSELKEDYKSAVKMVNLMEQSDLKARQLSLNEECVDHEHVAMDFTGTRGRVVEDPTEASEVAWEEAHQWRKKGTGRKVAPDCELGRPSFLSKTSGMGEQFAQGLGAGVHMVQPWFHSGISRQEAVELITRHGVVDGVFLLRDSQSTVGVHVLSLAHNHRVKHCQIRKVDVDGSRYYSLDGGYTKFTDLIQLVEFYQLNAAGLPTKLSHHVSGLL